VFARKIGIDLGTSTVQVYVRGEGIVTNEPSVAAVDPRDGRLRAIGRQAMDLAAHAEEQVRLVQPVSRGIVAHAPLAQDMLLDLIASAQGRRRLFRPEVMVCVPAGADGDQRRALIDTAIAAGARQAWLMEAPLAAALGLGLPVAEPGPHGVCDVGGGLLQVAVISLSGIAASDVVPAGGEQLDASVAAFLRERYGLEADQRGAEAVKIAVGAATALDEPRTAVLDGTIVSSNELTRTIQDWLDNVIDAVRRVLDQTPRRLATGLTERGFFLVGGGALMPGVDGYLSREIGIPFQVASDPQTCTVRGTRRALGDFEVVHRRQLYLGGL
jgi:rod shape-determining protein MreB and related proteins